MTRTEQNRRSHKYRVERQRNGRLDIPQVHTNLTKTLERGWLTDAEERECDASIRAACEQIHLRRKFREDEVVDVEMPVVCLSEVYLTR